MMKQEPSAGRPDQGPDMFARLGDGQLIKLVLEAVDTVESFIPVSSDPNLNPRQILTLLTYCYARGVYSSEEIEGRLPGDNAIAYICAGEKPDWHMLRRFRRLHVFLLTETLTQLLKLAAPVNGMSAERVPGLVIPYEAHARFRVQLAMQADSIAMDA
jgi:hypothetical protein